MKDDLEFQEPSSKSRLELEGEGQCRDLSTGNHAGTTWGGRYFPSLQLWKLRPTAFEKLARSHKAIQWTSRGWNLSVRSHLPQL